MSIGEAMIGLRGLQGLRGDTYMHSRRDLIDDGGYSRRLTELRKESVPFGYTLQLERFRGPSWWTAVVARS